MENCAAPISFPSFACKNAPWQLLPRGILLRAFCLAQGLFTLKFSTSATADSTNSSAKGAT